MPGANKKTRKVSKKSRKNLKKSRKSLKIRKNFQKGGYVLFRAQLGEPVASDEVKHTWSQ
jgi:hypothetical protein